MTAELPAAALVPSIGAATSPAWAPRLATALDDAALAARLARRGRSAERRGFVIEPARPRSRRLVRTHRRPSRSLAGLTTSPQRSCVTPNAPYLVGSAAIAARARRPAAPASRHLRRIPQPCRDDPFWEQPVALERIGDAPTDFGYTGYLVDPQTVLTCWHWAGTISSRAQVAVFGYARRDAASDPLELPVSQVLPVAARPASDPGAAPRVAGGAAHPAAVRHATGCCCGWNTTRHALGALARGARAAARRSCRLHAGACGLPLKLADHAPRARGRGRQLPQRSRHLHRQFRLAGVRRRQPRAGRHGARGPEGRATSNPSRRAAVTSRARSGATSSASSA